MVSRGNGISHLLMPIRTIIQIIMNDAFNYSDQAELCSLIIGEVVQEDKDYIAQCIDKTNQLVSDDNRVDNLLLTLGDGTHLIFKH
ncbi:unnamed protein product [Onchocerca flexuosa]|uniref:Uncharacterized protein n=1 Tax=Onchocerca flexuosa TaxID=387005 RepID=A0A183HN16_9BILA|nr:unnamed protein product [Onchocerca flexuosa]